MSRKLNVISKRDISNEFAICILFEYRIIFAVLPQDPLVLNVDIFAFGYGGTVWIKA